MIYCPYLRRICRRGEFYGKKYLIRIVGALCILASLALLFVPALIEVDGIKRSDLREVREHADSICTDLTDYFIEAVEWDDDLKDEFKDYDLPNSKGKIKSRYGEIGGMVDSVLDGSISLEELFAISAKAPGVVEDVANLLETSASNSVFVVVTEYLVYNNVGEMNYYTHNPYYMADKFEEVARDVVDEVSEYTIIFIAVAAVLALIAFIAVLSAITHVCNKGRGWKYLFLVIVILILAGTCAGLYLASDVIADAVENIPALEDVSLQVGIMPFLSIITMAVPIVLDIIFERKRK